MFHKPIYLIYTNQYMTIIFCFEWRTLSEKRLDIIVVVVVEIIGKNLEVFITERSSNYGWGLNGIPFVLNLELILIVHLFADLFIRCHSKDMNNVLMCSLTFLLRSTSVSSNLCIDVSVGIWPVIVSCYYCDLFECIQTPLGVSASFLFSFRCTYHWINNVYIVLYMNKWIMCI